MVFCGLCQVEWEGPQAGGEYLEHRELAHRPLAGEELRLARAERREYRESVPQSMSVPDVQNGRPRGKS